MHSDAFCYKPDLHQSDDDQGFFYASLCKENAQDDAIATG